MSGEFVLALLHPASNANAPITMAVITVINIVMIGPERTDGVRNVNVSSMATNTNAAMSNAVLIVVSTTSELRGS